MATVTQIYAIEYVADLLEEDPELLEAIVENRDNLTYGSVISVHTGQEKAIAALTADGIEELRRMLADARRSTGDWDAFLDDFVSDQDIISRLKGHAKG